MPSIKKYNITNINRIIPIEVIQKIIDDSNKYKDSKKRFNIIEIALSLQIIGRILGDKWYKNVLRKFKPGKKITNREYRKLVKSNEVHPLSEALWSGEPKQYIRLISLAQYLNQLWRFDDSNNFQQKVNELQQYSFIHTYYELKIASYFDRREFSVKFIKKRCENPRISYRFCRWLRFL